MADTTDDYYTAERDADGGIRLAGGRGLMVADKDNSETDVAGWFARSVPGSYREQYRAALRLLRREKGEPDVAPTHPDETSGAQPAQGDGATLTALAGVLAPHITGAPLATDRIDATRLEAARDVLAWVRANPSVSLGHVSPTPPLDPATP